jgi:hypothetical protein
MVVPIRLAKSTCPGVLIGFGVVVAGMGGGVSYRRSSIAGGLELEELRVAAVGLEQLLVRPELGHVSVGDDGDPIGNAHRREAVRDDDADPPLEVLLQLGEDPGFRFRVE